MAAKYYCDCCGKEINVSEEHIKTKVEISYFTKKI